MSTQSAKSDAAAKAALYQQIARVAAALGSEARLQILEYVAQGERSVDTLARMTGLSIANCSKHLQALRAAGLVQARKEGLYVFYSLAGDDVVELYSVLHRVSEARVAEVEKIVRTWLKRKDDLEPVPAAELMDRAAKGLVVVIDVRPPEEYAAGHVPGAINVPIEQLESRMSKFPKRKEVVAYCRGPYCLMSFDAVRTLRDHGLKARRLEAGLPEWRAAGRPIET
jgi:rhodanese-related sulfurtransferase/DNA-binding transcriptional ArsR family regulator